ncbi:hypothetical protein LCGC14_2830320, partial [marine sediment metagenome]
VVPLLPEPAPLEPIEKPEILELPELPTLEQITETVIEIVKKRIDKEVETFNKLVDFTSNSFKNFIKTTQKAGQKLTQFSRRFIKEIDKGIDFFAFGVKRSINLVIDQMKELQPEEPLEKDIVEKPKPGDKIKVGYCGKIYLYPRNI